MTSELLGTQPEENAAHTEQNAEQNTKQNTEQQTSGYMVGETEVCYTKEPCADLPQTVSPISSQAPSPSVRVAVVPVASRLELALLDAKKYPKRCTRWYYREELVNKQALETMLDEYHSVRLLAIALNCSEHMVYRAIRHHGITYPRAYPSVKAKELLQL